VEPAKLDSGGIAGDMEKSKVYIIRLFLRRPGDLYLRNVSSKGDLTAAEALAQRELLARFNDPSLPATRRPRQAHLVDDDDGSTVLRLLINARGEVLRNSD
jgi:hypothetical protein